MFKEICINEIPKDASRRRNPVVSDEIEKFLDSGFEACELEVGRFKTRNSASTTFRNAVRRGNYPVRVVSRSNRLFLVREDSE